MTDPDGRRVRFEAFSTGDQADAAVAVTWIKDTLKKTPCCVKEGRAQQILAVIDSPNRDIVLKYRPDMKPSNCGFTPLSTMIGANNTIRIGPNAWDCCRGGSPTGWRSLASVILHELHHALFKTPEGPADEAMTKCLGCHR